MTSKSGLSSHQAGSGETSAEPDNANVLVRPPIALLLAVIAGIAADWLYPQHFVPANIPTAWLGGALFLLGLALASWAVATFRTARTRVQTFKGTSTIVTGGPYRITRNPIYLGMFIGLTGLAVAFNNLWLLAALVVFFLVIRFGVVAREEAYLEGKFGDTYRSYKARIRRWL